MRAVEKGRRGEQDVARWLYRVWFKSEPPADRTTFVRVGLGRKQPAGDLIVPDDFPFFVEVKNREVSADQLFELKGELLEWIATCPMPCLLFVKFRRKWVVLIKALSLHNFTLSNTFIAHLPNLCCFVALMSLERLTNLLESVRHAVNE